ncbi:MAG: RsmD family RNA methyltransferase, partial [Terriglobia bacterium]
GTEAQVDTGGALPLLRRLVLKETRLDFVFLDPPYRDHAAYEKTMQFLGEQPILREDAIVVAEHSRREPLVSHPAMEPYRTVEQGEAAVTFFRLVAGRPR